MGDIPTVNPLKNGLVRIKREERDPAPPSEEKASISSSGSVEITIYPKTTAAGLKAQLAALGIKNIGKELEEIAGRNGNATFEANELYPLDARLESLLSRSKEYFFRAAGKNPRIIAKADPSIEPEINEWAWKQIKSDFGERSGKIREIVIAAVKHYASALVYADEMLWRDKKTVLAVVRNGASLKNITGPFKNDPEVNLAALLRDPLFEFKNIDASLKKNEVFLLDAVKRNAPVIFAVIMSSISQKRIGDVMQRYADWFKANIPFLKKAFQLNPAVFDYIPSRLRSIFSNGHLKKFATLGIEITRRLKNLKTMKEIISNRENIGAADRRPLAVLVYAKSDWNGALAHNQIEELIRRGYRVVYFEVKNEKEAYRSLLLATQKKKADLLIFAGHGAKTHLALGADDPSQGKITNEEKYIDISDENEMLKMRLAERLSRNAVIILESCSTGEGKREEKNVANLMGKVFPQATIFSPTEDTKVGRYVFDRENRVIGVQYGSPHITYAIKR